MSKIFVVLDEKDLISVESICLDKDPKEAIEFVTKVIAPRINKALPCLARELMRGER